ncbi:uncharacterized protein N7459_006889 [Penicillium hispanicum]|uniref:uncharacterized protein n=1 Tax=Penicillium hispanicum TaxID=1080232 RepID=UPI00254199A2|nr:uncharacterized protein N7459_006889 [Penicillium hispanicum]KAJ5577925.1 hypothetical protein N7459_006889 [Penicillium hispanicum]
MYQWTSNYADDDPDAIESRMTAENKQAIIDYLGDWCLYDDWDSLVASFSPLTHLDRFQLLLTAVVLKDIFERVVRNPFFYIDLGEDWDGSGSELPPPYGIELNKLFQKMLKVSATDANNWRASTIRLFNRYQEHTESDTPLEGKDVTPGLRSYNIREKCIDQFTTNILDSSSLIAPILSSKELSQDQTRLRYRGIRRCYKSACKMAVRFSLHTPGIRFDDNVTEVAPYKVPRYDPHGLDVNRWVASIFSGPSIYKELLEGRRVVLVLWPATWMIEWHEPPHIRRWRELSADVRKRREEKLARYITDYDRQYRDENGDEHVITASGIVVVEKDGRESPIDSSSD